MPTYDILKTKLFIPPPRPVRVTRSRLIERLNEGLHRKLILISAPAGFGKTTLVSEWVAGCERPSAIASIVEAIVVGHKTHPGGRVRAQDSLERLLGWF